MGFFDDLKRTLDSAFGVPVSDRGSIIGEDQYLNREGVKPHSDEELVSPPSDPYGLDLADAIAVKQRGTIGFNTVNITPKKLSLANFPLMISKSRLYEIVGSDADDAQLTTLHGVEEPTTYQPIKFWRTIPLNIMGNFLKLEMLPTKVNYANNGVDSGIVFLNAENPSIFNENNTRPEYYDELQYPGNTKIFESNPVILIQFETVDAGIIVVKPGDCFKLPFTQVFITVKVGAPRFQLIYGYNSEIVADSQNRLMNSNPAFGPGRSLWDSPSRHCVPFTLGYGSVATGHSVFGDQSYYLVSAGGIVLDHYLMTNSAIAIAGTDIDPRLEGVGHGWISSVSCQVVFNNSNVGDFYQIYFCLRIVGREAQVDPDASGDVYAKSKPLVMIPMLIYSNGSGISRQEKREFSMPLRFTLDKGQCLIASTKYVLPSGRDLKMTWDVQGYTFGRLARGGPEQGIFTQNVLTMDSVTEAAFPLDQDYGLGTTWTPGAN